MGWAASASAGGESFFYLVPLIWGCLSCLNFDPLIWGLSLNITIMQEVPGWNHEVLRAVRTDLMKQFERLRYKPNTTAVFLTFTDSSILPACFTHAQAEDKLVVRNSGNVFPTR